MVDLNCDMGEGFGIYSFADDEEIMPFIDAANVACGFHASDPNTMRKTVELAKKYNVKVGSHPAYPDLVGFGRRPMKMKREEIKNLVMYQTGAIKAFLDEFDMPLNHIKPHGSLYGVSAKEEDVANGIADAAEIFNVGIFGMVNTFHEKVYKDFIQRLIKSISALKVGHALKEGSQMGPVSSETQLHSNLDYVKKGKSEAKLAFGGNPISLDTPGYYMEPTLFIDGDNKSTINQEEMFGPIACVIPVKSYEEGLEVANDTIFGLSSGIITQSLSKAADFKKNIKTGVTTVNLPTAGLDYHVPFGGRKASSFGPREQGTYAHEFFTHVKTAYVSPGKIN